MEHRSDRVLAYYLSTPLQSDDLEQVSGGASQAGRYMTQHITGERKEGDITIDSTI